MSTRNSSPPPSPPVSSTESAGRPPGKPHGGVIPCAWPSGRSRALKCRRRAHGDRRAALRPPRQTPGRGAASKKRPFGRPVHQVGVGQELQARAPPAARSVSTSTPARSGLATDRRSHGLVAHPYAAPVPQMIIRYRRGTDHVYWVRTGGQDGSLLPRYPLLRAPPVDSEQPAHFHILFLCLLSLSRLYVLSFDCDHCIVVLVGGGWSGTASRRMVDAVARSYVVDLGG